MAWIRTINEDDATGYLKTLYKKYGDPFEGVESIWKIHSLNPESLRFHYDLYKHLMTGKSGLSRMQREMIAIVVASVNNCQYALEHHGESLFQLTKNRSLVDTIKTDFRSADIGEKDITMLEYVEKLAGAPCDASREEIAVLKEVGFKDADILDLVTVAAYFAFVTRLACGLGVAFEEPREHKPSPFD